jgi:S1-C subfamily serine protease
VIHWSMAGSRGSFGSSLALVAAALLAFPAQSAAAERDGRRDLFAERRHVRAATVTLPLRSCAGSVAGSRTQVLTAAHCIPEGAAQVEVIFRGRPLRAVVALLDRTRDTALLALDEALDVEPLELALDLPKPGDRVLFVGRVDRPSQTQVVRVVRLGRCPSLPGVSDAVFTSLKAKPGDSGAPILNEELRIVGVIHGGASCHIAAPTAVLARSLAASSRVQRSPGPAPDDDWGERATYPALPLFPAACSEISTNAPSP